MLQYTFKPLAMIAIILIAFWNLSSPITFYQKMILAGLFFSLIGDTFLIEKDRFFIFGLGSFFIGHLCYIAAFYSAGNPFLFLPYLAYSIIFIGFLRKAAGKLKIPIIFYSAAIAAMSYFALCRYLLLQDQKSFYAFLGSLFFVASDTILGLEKFRVRFAPAHFLILSTYFLAQWLIALSI